MAFLDVYNALYDQLSNDPTLTAYPGIAFEKVYKEPTPQEKYTLLLNPSTETEDQESRSYRNTSTKEITYDIGLGVRMIFAGKSREEFTLGWTETRKNKVYPGILAFMEDAKEAIRKDETLNYNAPGYSESSDNASSTFDLNDSNRYLSVSILGKTPVGFDSIDCGNSTLSGDDVALNIQNSLRALENAHLRSNDGYKDVEVTFNPTNNRFKIQPVQIGPASKVTVTAGATNDCSALLGFDNPTEERGKNIKEIEFDPVFPLDGEIDGRNKYPVIVRIMKIFITEERYVGG